jgi:hypothetical protein
MHVNVSCAVLLTAWDVGRLRSILGKDAGVEKMYKFLEKGVGVAAA